MDTLGARVAQRSARGVSTRAELVDGRSNGAYAIIDGVSRDLNAGDNGMTLQPSTSITYSIPDGLPDGFSCSVQANGTTTIAKKGGSSVTLNGGTSNVTRAAATAANSLFNIRQRNPATDYLITGA